jgi:pyruvate dehydrogenase E1 component
MRRMFHAQENVFYYVTLTNEKYPHPAMPEGAAAGILKGMYLLREDELAAAAKRDGAPHVQLLGSGAILREVIAASDLLRHDFAVTSDIWSVPSFNELARDGAESERWNRLHPGEEARLCYVERCLSGRRGPVVAASDYVRSHVEAIRAHVPSRFSVLGTDGYGRSDGREKLRSFFEVDRYHVVVAALSALAADGVIEASRVGEAIAKYGVDPDRPAPTSV